MRGSLLRASAAGLAALALAGCSWRLETPPPDWPSPAPVTVMRDGAAEREHAVLEGALDASRSGGATTAQATVLSEVEEDAATERLEAFGGLYVAYPDSTASPSPSPERPDVVGLAIAARDGHLAEALVAEDDDLALLLASAGLSHALSVWYSSWVADAIAQSTQPVAAERLLDSDALPDATAVPDAPGIDPALVADLVVRHDRARYAYEVLAARADGEERGPWLVRRDIHADRAAALAAVPGIEDRRRAVYVLPGEASADAAARRATAQEVENAAGATYAALLDGASASDMPWLLHAAFDAYAQGAAFGDPTAEAFAVPALPGVATAAR